MIILKESQPYKAKVLEYEAFAMFKSILADILQILPNKIIMNYTKDTINTTVKEI